MKKTFLHLSLLITLPINIFLFIWVFDSAKIYLNLDKYNQSLPKGARLARVMESVYYDLIYKSYHFLGIKKKTDINLIIKSESLNELNQNLPISGSSYKKDAILIINNNALIGKAKLRGDFFYHWAFPRQSWRFKSSKRNIYKDTRTFNFIVPKHDSLLSNNLSYKLAKELNLMAPQSQLVDFSINGTYKGIRLMVEQLDESFLRKNKKMPGDIYKGDNIAQKEYIGVNVSLFKNPSIWNKSSYNNHYQKDNIVPLTSALKDLSQYRYQLLDTMSFAAMSVLIDLTASYHYDNSHNWVLYYDPYLEKISPIIWDTNGWFSENIKKKNLNIITSDLFSTMYHNYDFLRAKYHVLNRFYLSKELNFIRILEDEIEKANKFINRNGYVISLGRNTIMKKRALQIIEQFKNNILNQMLLVKNYFVGAIDKENYRYTFIKDKIRLSISGSKLIKGILIKLNNKIKTEQVYISYKQADKIIIHNIIDRVSINKKELLIDLELLAKPEFSGNRLEKTVYFSEMTYDLDLIEINKNDIESISLLFQNHNQEELKLSEVNTIEQISMQGDISNIISNNRLTKTQTWSGNMYFSDLTVFKDNISIEQGTHLFFEEGASIKILGKLTANGTKENPIIFEAKDINKPWGALILKDEGSNNSVLKHVIFKNGSGAKGELYEYTAMFSVHNVKKLLVENCSFFDSKVTDDMVHVVYSDVVFKFSEFIRSNSDALDVDISNIIVENCTFNNSGNDSIDLMTSNAIIINSAFNNSTDKGISIGEDSKLLATNNLISNNEIGMQCKDSSKAFVYNTSFLSNNKAVDAYQKNWRYSEGGTIHLENCIMEKNIGNATLDKKSKVVMNNCRIDTLNNFDQKSIRKGKIVIDQGKPIKTSFVQPFFKNHIDLTQNQMNDDNE